MSQKTLRELRLDLPDPRPLHGKSVQFSRIAQQQVEAGSHLVLQLVIGQTLKHLTSRQNGMDACNIWRLLGNTLDQE